MSTREVVIRSASGDPPPRWKTLPRLALPGPPRPPPTGGRVDHVSSLGEFLRNRRGRLRPEQVGLPPGNRRRQTPGLRREELATLAGVSVDYYIRLEQGRDTRPSEAVGRGDECPELSE
ncbi:helix-turn-helix domain-containing protein [Micromonospora sp. CPCC 205371]|nr:helix-turn-helix domain-containing protein [Micromonospora sp. CPCC 205371]